MFIIFYDYSSIYAKLQRLMLFVNHFIYYKYNLKVLKIEYIININILEFVINSKINNINFKQCFL